LPPPRTQYAQHGNKQIAYQVFGEGETEVLWIPSFVSHLEFFWTDARVKKWLERIASFSRLVMFDKLGTGLSDPVNGIPTVEDRAEEIDAVIRAVGFERPALFGLSEGGPSSIYYAATRADRVRALVLFGTYAQGMGLAQNTDELLALLRERGIEEQYIPTVEGAQRMLDFREATYERWGSGDALDLLVPSFGNKAALGLLERLSASPGMARATMESASSLDVADLLPSITAPTLVVHATDDLVPFGYGKFLAEKIPGARLLQVEGSDHAPWLSDPDKIAGEIEEFLTGSRHEADPTRALMTVLFTDIVGSTERAAELGDARWRSLLEEHDRVTRAAVARQGGKAVKSTGDGYLATFDGPARAIGCAEDLIDELRGCGIEIRAGIHTGEVEIIGDDIGGMAVHLAARVNALADAGEILASRTVRDLVVGSGVAFTDRGEHELKGVPGRWDLVAVAPKGAAAKEPRSPRSRRRTPATTFVRGTGWRFRWPAALRA
jgi:pimeloyl-ACP methyl ester carboxylesterase